MPSIEFYGEISFASCQYHAEEFFTAVENATGKYPQLDRAQRAFEALYDEVFSASNGETAALKKEITQITQDLKIDLRSPAGQYAVFGLMAQQLEAVFAEAEANEADVMFRWG